MSTHMLIFASPSYLMLQAPTSTIPNLLRFTVAFRLTHDKKHAILQWVIPLRGYAQSYWMSCMCCDFNKRFRDLCQLFIHLNNFNNVFFLGCDIVYLHHLIFVDATLHLVLVKDLFVQDDISLMNELFKTSSYK